MVFDRTESKVSEAEEPPSGQSPNDVDPLAIKAEEKSGGILSWIKAFFKPSEASLHGSLAELIEESQRDQDEAPFESAEKQLLVNILRLRDLSAADISIPRADIEAIHLAATLTEIIEFMTTYPHSRIPVYEENLDDIVGMLHIKDILTAIHNMSDIPSRNDFAVKDFMRDILFISPAIRVHDLLLEMREKRLHIAVIVDEYGGTDGIVTIEDVVESIIGEIDDIDEVEGEMLQRLDHRSVIANARTPIDVFEEEFGPILTEEEREDDIDTLGGLVAYIAGHMPMRGELIRHDCGVMFEILAADPRRVILLKVSLSSKGEELGTSLRRNDALESEIPVKEISDVDNNVHMLDATLIELPNGTDNDMGSASETQKQTRQA